MASQYKFESRDDRIERMMRNNQRLTIQQAIAIVDGIWEQRRKLILSQIPLRFKEADIEDLGYLKDILLADIQGILSPSEVDSKTGLILCGPPGSGKTYAVFAALKWLANQNPEIIASIRSYSRTIQSLRDEFLSGSYSEIGSTWDKLMNESGMYSGVIFLDDAVSQKPTDFEIDKLLMVLDHRLDNYMPFIITTNIAPEDFQERFGERIASRLIGTCHINVLSGLDRRLMTREENREYNQEEHGE